MSLFRRITDKSSIVFECREISEEQREELTKLVEKHGGRVGDSMDPIIFMPRLKYVRGTYINLQVFDIQYIQACVARGKLLSLGHFRLTPEKRGGRCQRTTFLTGECIFKRALADVTLAENCNYDSASLSEDDETVEAIECRVLNVSRVETAKTARSGVDASQSATHEEPVDRDEKIASNVSEQGIAANPSPERVSQSSDRATFRTALSGSVTKDTSSTPDTTVWESQVLSSDIEVDVIDDDTQIYKMLLKGSKSDNVKRSPEKRIPIEKTMASSSSESPLVRQSPSSQVETTRKHDLECMKSPVKQFKSISPGDVRRASNESLIDLLSGRKTPSPIQEFETARDDVEETPVARDFEPGSSEANTLPSNVALSEAAKRCDKAVANEENEKSAAKDQPENREEDEKSPRDSLRDSQSPLVSHSRFVLHKNSLEPSSGEANTLPSNAASSEAAKMCDKAAANEENEKSAAKDQPENREEDEKSPRESLRDPQSPLVSHSRFVLNKNSLKPGLTKSSTLSSNAASSEAAKMCDKAAANEENEKSAAKDQPENREEDEKSPRESLRDPQSPLVSHSRFVLHKNSLEPSSSKSSTLSSNAASSEPAERCDKAAANEESEKSGDEDQPEDCEEDEKSPRASLRDPQSPIVSHSSFFLHKNSIELGSSKSSMLSSNVALSEAAERCDKAAANGGNEKSTEKDQPEDREEDEKSPKESLRDSQSPIVSHSRFFLHKNSLEPGSSKSSTLSSNVPLSEAAERCDKAAANGGNEKSAEKDQPEDCEEDEKSPKESLRDPESPLVSPSPSSKSATTRKPLTKYYKSPVRKLKWIAPDDFQKSSKKRLRSTVDSADDDDGDETLFLDHDAIEISGEKVTLLKAAPIEPGESTDEATASRLTESCGKSRTKAKSENDSSLSDLPSRYTSPSSPETSNGTSAVVPLSKRRKRSFASPEAEQTKTKEGPYKTSGKRAKPGSSRIIIAETSSEDDDDEGLSAKTQAAAKRTHADTTECVISEDDEDDAWLPVKRRVAAKRTDTSSIENLSKESDEDYKPELVQRRRKADMPSRDHEKQLRFHQNWRAKLNAGVTQQEPGLRRLKFTSSDRKEMVKFLCTFEDIEAVQPKGLKVWALMIKSGLLSYRTVKSLQNHFTKSILPTIEEYFDGMSEAHQAQFLKIRGSKRG